MEKEALNFQENPDRAVDVFGEIDRELVYKLTPEIREYRRNSCDPITVYIDSPGGDLSAFGHLSGLLFGPDNQGKSCRIITVATGQAASAAARLLAKGDYAIAHPHSSIHCHGARLGELRSITREAALSLSENLDSFNEEMANDFTSKSLEGLVQRIVLRTGRGSVLEYFNELLSDKIESIAASIVVDEAINDYYFGVELDQFLLTKSRANQIENAKKKGKLAYDSKLFQLITQFIETKVRDSYSEFGLLKSHTEKVTELFLTRRSMFEEFIRVKDDPEPLLRLLGSTSSPKKGWGTERFAGGAIPRSRRESFCYMAIRNFDQSKTGTR